MRVLPEPHEVFRSGTFTDTLFCGPLLKARASRALASDHFEWFFFFNSFVGTFYSVPVSISDYRYLIFAVLIEDKKNRNES